MIKKTFLLAAISLVSGATFAADNGLDQYGLSLSGSVALTSDYRFRGITQAENDPAIQGSFTLAHNSGLYFSAFASNVKVGNASMELDPQIGYTTPLQLGSIKPTLDVGVVYYNYPSESDANSPEFYGKLTFADVLASGDSLLTNVNYTPDFWGKEGPNGWNFTLGYSVPFADTGFGGVASVGYTKVDEDDFFGGGNDDYVDWKVGVNYNVKSVEGLTAELAAVGTNIDTDGMTSSEKRAVDTGAVFTLTKTF
ncbi:hypothetical protein F4V57_11025 [Acinetobacter qingfengensis]|uniref:Porin n=1 Tax=Acinetobacter qingfengensis TaxID=1262585 RepID=A0A1E7RD53_9GAMM|nr:TorF family putative porin [Acinetobacter qingfengensis]KAA8732144.1 hypothetical protein F4V57_11025 [Acinetobacter qingfengensis]OEY97223.1 hypothetical protein BJI46_02010 [Acinetobacter qingfengensis]